MKIKLKEAENNSNMVKTINDLITEAGHLLHLYDEASQKAPKEAADVFNSLLDDCNKQMKTLGKLLKTFQETEGTQTTDIEKKVSYPQFKKGKTLVTPLQESVYDNAVANALLASEASAISEYEETLKDKGISTEFRKLIEHILEEEKEHYEELRKI